MKEQELAPALWVIDDEPGITQFLTDYLQESFSVTPFHSALAALQKLETAPAPAIVITDLKMPEIDGLTLSQRVKQLSPHTEVIILTGYASFDSLLEGLRSQSIFDYLIKPIAHPGELEYTLNRALYYQRMRAENSHLLDQLQTANQQLSVRVDEQTHALQSAYEEVQGVERLKSEFLSNISHELQSPMTPLEGYIDLFLAGELGSVSDEQREIMETMQLCVKRLRRQIDNVLLLTMLNSQKVQPEKDEFFFHDFLHNLEKMFAYPLQLKHQQLVLQMNAPRTKVVGDIQQILKVLLIILDNAVKFSADDSSIFIRTRQLSAATLQSRLSYPLEPNQLLQSFLPEQLDPAQFFLEISIEDRGQGIPTDQLPHVIRSFYQVDGSNTREGSGMGIGLSIAQKMLRAHRSLLYIESQVGVGTIFSFVLPMVA